MLQVTVHSVSANNLQTSLPYLYIIEWVFVQCWFSLPTAKVTGLWLVPLSNTSQGQEMVYVPGVGVLAEELGWLCTDAETFAEFFDFPDR